MLFNISTIPGTSRKRFLKPGDLQKRREAVTYQGHKIAIEYAPGGKTIEKITGNPDVVREYLRKRGLQMPNAPPAGLERTANVSADAGQEQVLTPQGKDGVFAAVEAIEARHGEMLGTGFAKSSAVRNGGELA